MKPVISNLTSQISRLIIILLLLGSGHAFSQSADNNMSRPAGEVVDSVTTDKVLQECEKRFPKFYREFNYIKTHDTLIQKFVFMRYHNDTGPARAGPKGNIFIDIKYLEKEIPTFTDDRLIVVLYHEIGHLHYFQTVIKANWTQQDSEQAAFEYSLLKTKEMAENGDCLPLKTGVKFMKMRSEGNNLKDPHVRALKRMVQQPLYAGYVQYVKEKCP